MSLTAAPVAPARPSMVMKSGPGAEGELEVGLDVAGGELDAIGALGQPAQLVDLALEVLAAGDVGKRDGLMMSVPSESLGRRRSRPSPCQPQVAAHARLGRLAELDLDGVDLAQVLLGRAVAVGDVLEDVPVAMPIASARMPPSPEHMAVAPPRCRGPGPPGPPSTGPERHCG